jgi:hypothetical protein
MDRARKEALRFFMDHAGYSYDPATETPFQGRWRTAKALTDAERRLKAGPFYVTTEPDDMPWDADVPWDGPVLVVTLWSVDGSDTPTMLGSLSGIGAYEGDPYLRVVAAELADEYLPGVPA